jgi:receptor protein-tyrosine kinase
LTPDARTAVIAAARRTFGPSSTGRLQVIDRARVPRDPSSPIVPLIVALAALAGVVVAAFVVIGREARRKRRVDERDLFALEPEFLGTVHAPASRNPSRAIPAESRPDSPAAQEYRVLAGRLGLLEPSEEPQNLMLLDSSDGSLAASTALNLAAVLSQAGSTVLLMDANTLGFGVSDLLRLNGRTGYSELVADPDRGAVNGQRAELSVARGSGLYIVPRGVGEAPHFVPAERAARVLDRLSVGADVVILAGPPVMRSPAALVWSRAVERSVLVIDEEEGSAESISQAVNVLTSAHGEFAGTVLARRREPLSPMARRTAERRRVS